jgi:hypothetical protein
MATTPTIFEKNEDIPNHPTDVRKFEAFRSRYIYYLQNKEEYTKCFKDICEEVTFCEIYIEATIALDRIVRNTWGDGWKDQWRIVYYLQFMENFMTAISTRSVKSYFNQVRNGPKPLIFSPEESNAINRMVDSMTGNPIASFRLSADEIIILKEKQKKILASMAEGNYSATLQKIVDKVL